MEFDEKFGEEIRKKIEEAMESETGAKKFIEETIRELTKELKEAKSKEDMELIEKKIEMLEEMLKTYQKGKGDEEDIKELQQVLGTVSEHLPKIMDSIFGPIKELLNDVYDPEKAEKFGKNVANFYKELVGAGMDPDKAFELTKEYMESMNIIKTLVAAFMKERMGKLEGLKDLGNIGKKKKIEIEEEEEFEEEL
ncbi:hypothetical protein OCC_03247 [Thermococcus litoralis DSM 5473]|uniref:Uncharacterized protein n=1 Tax=Thermococcus litoralis (strain ATCC 51850 / DSM 5473 / JCM 8560 / NS-C) TaxID=523849 RepID=H3ZQ71_THELN|nr:MULTISPECIES: hypothetical protein [Thermococcus]EHR77865.1 hypothetical protein OCC_03247 [Thermococcus litoralis DSM 5473]MCO6040619.1 hypothetical protein [Thermococcus alcaliphilus]